MKTSIETMNAMVESGKLTTEQEIALEDGIHGINYRENDSQPIELYYTKEVKTCLDEALKQAEKLTKLKNTSISILLEGNNVKVTIKPTNMHFIAEFFTAFGANVNKISN